MTRVVVVDDDPDIRGLVEYKLGAAGFEVHVAEDGQAGLELCREVAPQVAVVDVSMPRMSGLDLLAALRRTAEFRDLPVVLLTAMAQDSDIRAGLDAGASAYVTKPFSPAELAVLVARLAEDEARSSA